MAVPVLCVIVVIVLTAGIKANTVIIPLDVSEYNNRYGEIKQKIETGITSLYEGNTTVLYKLHKMLVAPCFDSNEEIRTEIRNKSSSKYPFDQFFLKMIKQEDKSHLMAVDNGSENKESKETNTATVNCSLGDEGISYISTAVDGAERLKDFVSFVKLGEKIYEEAEKTDVRLKLALKHAYTNYVMLTEVLQVTNIENGTNRAQRSLAEKWIIKLADLALGDLSYSRNIINAIDSDIAGGLGNVEINEDVNLENLQQILLFKVHRFQSDVLAAISEVDRKVKELLIQLNKVAQGTITPQIMKPGEVKYIWNMLSRNSSKSGVVLQAYSRMKGKIITISGKHGRIAAILAKFPAEIDEEEKQITSDMALLFLQLKAVWDVLRSEQLPITVGNSATIIIIVILLIVGGCRKRTQKKNNKANKKGEDYEQICNQISVELV